MRRKRLTQYALIASAWILAIASWPCRAAEMNEFFGWSGEVDTPLFVRTLFAEPRSIIRFWSEQRPAPLQFAWLLLALAGFASFVFAFVVIRRGRAGALSRAMAAVLLALPLALIAPTSWHLPQPRAGMYLLGSGHALMAAALLITTHPDVRGVETDS
jgi:hypothetical protein